MGCGREELRKKSVGCGGLNASSGDMAGDVEEVVEKIVGSTEDGDLEDLYERMAEELVRPGLWSQACGKQNKMMVRHEVMDDFRNFEKSIKPQAEVSGKLKSMNFRF